MHQHQSRLVRIRAERRARRIGRGLLATAAVAALGLSAGLATLPAQAATAVAPRVRVVAGDSALTASWAAVPGAARYTVKISEQKSLAKARVVTTTVPTVTVRKLRNGHTYYVGVTSTVTPQPAPTATATAAPATAAPAAAPGPAGAVTTVALTPTILTSAVAATTAHSGVPTPVSAVTVSPGPAANQVTVTWAGGDRTLKVAAIAASNVTMTDHTFHSPWYPSTTRSITLTVPEAFRTKIGAGSGDPVYVRVVQSNSGATRFHPTYDYADKYRASTVGSWTFAATGPTPAADVSKLRVAELNTQTNGASERFTKTDQWPARQPRVAKLIDSADADLLATAELSTNQDPNAKQCINPTATSYACAGRTQYLQLASQLSKLTLVDPDAYARVMDQQRSNKAKWAGQVTNGAHLFYNRDTLTLLDHGFFSPALKPSESFSNVTGLGVAGWMAVPDIKGDRWFTWARFQTNDAAHRVFYAVATHLPVGDSARVIDARAEAASLAEAAISKMAGSLPVVFAGDFNSDPTRNPNPAHTVFMQRGWFDSAAVADRSNMRYNTVNGTGPQDGADPGYPTRPYLQKWVTSRIDFILLKNSPYSYKYQNVLRLNSDGTFDRSYQGTDHNMQLADIGIGDPVS